MSIPLSESAGARKAASPTWPGQELTTTTGAAAVATRTAAATDGVRPAPAPESGAEVAARHMLLGDSLVMHRLRGLLRKLAVTNLPVLIYGPTGSGKELVARALHLLSGRIGRCVASNVCAINESLFEAALFGHLRGAFTGATADNPGLLMDADRGTAFLDEISGLPLHIQAKLLRAVETREFRPVGGRADRHSDFRLVAATNEDPAELVRSGRFRDDLLYRLSGAIIEVPSLAQRPEDIPLLAREFAQRARTGATASGVTNATAPGAISDAALALLAEQAWSGNVRELRLVVECAAALADRPVISRDDVLGALRLRRPLREPAQRAAPDRELLEHLAAHGWKVRAAADALGVHRATLYRRLQRQGVRRT